jgi:hypothetical protein
MFEARIVSRRGSLYFAAELTPYDLETLHMHIRALAPEAEDEDIRLEVHVDAADAAAPVLSAWLWRLAKAGVQVSRLPVTRHPPDVAA